MAAGESLEWCFHASNPHNGTAAGTFLHAIRRFWLGNPGLELEQLVYHLGALRMTWLHSRQMLPQLSTFPVTHFLTQIVASVSRQPCWDIFMTLSDFLSLIQSAAMSSCTNAEVKLQS
jgi:hypothetical protein